jgi:hypothetical protein
MGGVTIRMMGLEGRLQWRRHKPFKLRAKLSVAKKSDLFQWFEGLTRYVPRTGFRIQNLRFAQFLCGAQRLSRRLNKAYRRPENFILGAG